MTEVKKITANEAIVRMIGCANAGQLDDLYKIADQYKETTAKGGTTYWSIERQLKARPMIAKLTALPTTVKGLILQRPTDEEMVYLPENVSTFLSEFMIEWENKEAYKNHNIPLQNKILLHGETGNGKTTIARHIARIMNLPYVEINSDSVIDSHLGSTSSNIHNIFKDIKEPCILFWDEVDSIGKKRGTDLKTSAAHENDRMVNSMLVNIERLGNDVVFIGATNRHDILDSAFLRRFDTVIEIESPNTQSKEIFFNSLKQYYKFDSMDMDVSEMKSFSDIKTLFLKKARQIIRETICTPNPLSHTQNI